MVVDPNEMLIFKIRAEREKAKTKIPEKKETKKVVEKKVEKQKIEEKKEVEKEKQQVEEIISQEEIQQELPSFENIEIPTIPAYEEEKYNENRFSLYEVLLVSLFGINALGILYLIYPQFGFFINSIEHLGIFKFITQINEQNGFMLFNIIMAFAFIFVIIDYIIKRTATNIRSIVAVIATLGLSYEYFSSGENIVLITDIISFLILIGLTFESMYLTKGIFQTVKKEKNQNIEWPSIENFNF